MLRKWLEVINVCLAAAAVAAVVGGLMLSYSRSDNIPLAEVKSSPKPLPAHAFALPQKSYDAIGEPILALQYVAPKMQLPDLRKKLIFYGQNGRPDAESDNPVLHIGLSGSKIESATTSAGEKVYLVYDKERGGIDKYLFSPENRETSLWLEVEPGEGELLVNVGMTDENGEMVRKPDLFAAFNLKEREPNRGNGGKVWELDSWRVDGTLLARQRARWFGVDCFFERHGGDEYKGLIGKERIDFGEKDAVYSIFVGTGDAIIWDNGRWQAVDAGEQSRGHPMLVVKKIDERLMNLELWDTEGRRKVPLNLLKSMETWMPQNLQDEFKFLGARTRSQYVFEVDDEKMLLKPNDWLLLSREGWKKLSTIEDIDDYVDRKETGTLFVFDGVVKHDDQQVLKGTIYNSTRTECHDIELPVLKDGLVFHNLEKTRNVARNRDKKEPKAMAQSYVKRKRTERSSDRT